MPSAETKPRKPASIRSEDGGSATSLAAKLVEVAAAIPNVEKRGTNEQHKYQYAQAEDVVAAVRKELLARKVMLFPTCLGQTEDEVLLGRNNSKMRMARVTMRYRLLDAGSGEEISSEFVGVGMDSGDKATYKAYTAALKYFLIETFQIPIGDDPERDSPGSGPAGATPVETPAVFAMETEAEGPPLSGEQKRKLIAHAKDNGATEAWQFYRVVEWVGDGPYARVEAAKMDTLLDAFTDGKWELVLADIAAEAVDETSEKRELALTIQGRYPEGS